MEFARVAYIRFVALGWAHPIGAVTAGCGRSVSHVETRVFESKRLEARRWAVEPRAVRTHISILLK